MDCGTGVDFDYWSRVPTLMIWEAAAIMYGVDPRALALGLVTAEHHHPPDFTDDLRLLTSAVRAGRLAATPADAQVAPDKGTHVSTTSFIDWLRDNLHAELAARLQQGIDVPGHTGLSSGAEAARRLAALRALGGQCTFSSSAHRWRIKGLKALKAQEDRANRPRTSEKTLRSDLLKAADAERQAARGGMARGPF